MKTRIFFGAVMIAALAAVLTLDWRLEQAWPLRPWAAGGPVASILLFLVVLAFWELGRLARGAGLEVLPVSGLAGAAAVGLWPYWGRLLWPGGAGDALVALAGMVAGTIFAEQMIRFRTAEGLRRVAATSLGVLYLGVGTAAILSIRMTWGVAVLVMFLVAVKATDMVAYFVGSAAGRHKLIPWLSPGKSWEGTVGGLIGGAGAAALAAGLLGVRAIPLWQAAVLGAVFGAAGQFADLCESLLKRSAQAKDSGAAVPQFGGVLDMLDSPLLAAPVAWAIFSAIPGL
ncbi:MAG: phosphatidate cytidylyltransferase [Phycisphaerae bacterium]|nr:phosphatidate cytidylyltransferase [Phycisphaerae bacterium]